MKYTAIYVESFMSGSHRHSMTKMARLTKLINEDVKSMLIRAGIEDSIVFLFHGHPSLEGEENVLDSEIIESAVEIVYDDYHWTLHDDADRAIAGVNLARDVLDYFDVRVSCDEECEECVKHQKNL